MSAISQMLSADTSGLIRKTLPKGDYLCQIVEADILHGYWKPNPPKRPKARYFEVYVPTIEIIDFVPSGDEELDNELAAALEAFDENWKGFRPGSMPGSGRWVQPQEVPGHDKKVLCAGIANGLNFALAETTQDWEQFIEFAGEATRFYTSANTHGEPDGFVVKKLSSDPTNFTPLAITSGMPLDQIIEATKGAYLIVSLDIESDPEGKYDDKVVVAGTEAV